MGRLRALRLVRAVLVTAVVVSLAGAGHLLGGGTLPGPAVLLGLALLVLWPVLRLSARPLTLPILLGTLGTAQVGLHEAFTLLSVPPACAPAHGTAHGCRPGAVSVLSHHEPSGPGAALLAGHLLAAVAAALVLRRTEAALCSLRDWLRPLTAPPRRPRLLLVLLRPCTPPARRPAPVRRVLSRDRRRGAPAPEAGVRV